MNAYGYAAARGVLRGRREAELLAGCRLARRHPAGGEPPGSSARGAARTAASRPLGPARRADRSRVRALSQRPAHAPGRAPADRGVRAGGDGRAPRIAHDRRLHGTGSPPRAAAPLRAPARPPERPGRADGLRHAHGDRAGRRPRARARGRRSDPASPLARLRAAGAGRDRPRRAARPRVRGSRGAARRAQGGNADRDAGRGRRAPGDRSRAAPRRACGCASSSRDSSSACRSR